MCAFQLVSREGLAVSCVAFGSNAMLPFLEPNVQVVIFGAQALDDRQNPNSGKGTLWVYDDAFVLMTGEVEKPPRIVRNVPLQ
jgi:predicted GTPase